MKKIIASLLIFLVSTPISYAEYGVEALWMNLYSSIDSGSKDLQSKLLKKRLKEVPMTKKLNSTQKCPQKSKDAGDTMVDCLYSNIEFSVDEIEAIKNGNLSLFASHLNPSASVNETTLSNLQKELILQWSKMKVESTNQKKLIESVGTLGIYTDGITSNSSYDVSADLQKIHDIIFSKDLIYPGTEDINSENNLVWQGLSDFWQDIKNGNGVLSNAATSSGSTGTSWSGGSASSDSSENTSSITLNSCQPSDTPSLDANLLSDISSLLTNGTSNDSTNDDVTPSNNTASRPSSTGGTNSGGSNSGNSGDDDSFNWGCNVFFCIKMDLIYEQADLLIGGKSFAIETILDKNLKIVNKFKDLSFTPKKPSTQFFEIGNKNINLANLAYIGVIVSKRPAPILNISPSNSPRGSAPSDESREYDEMQTSLMSALGMKSERENSIENLSQGVSTDQSYQQWVNTLQEKLDSQNGYIAQANTSSDFIDLENQLNKKVASYMMTKESSVRSGFPDSFSRDLIEFTSSSNSLLEYVNTLGALAKKYRDIKYSEK